MVNLYEELGSYRSVAAVVGCDHKTVKAWLERTGREVSVAGVVRRRATDPFRHLIRERVEMTEGRVREETRVAPAERLEEERPLLRCLVERPPVATGESRKVDHLSTVRLGSARYSVPSRLRGEVVQVLVDGEEVRVFHRGCEVALHHLQPPGGASIEDDHYPTPAPTGVRPLRPRTRPKSASWNSANRPSATCERPRLPARRGCSSSWSVCSRERSHGREAVRAALSRAVEFGRFGHQDVGAILLAGGAAPPAHLERAQPLVLSGLPEVPKRGLESYRWSA